MQQSRPIVQNATIQAQIPANLLALARQGAGGPKVALLRKNNPELSQTEAEIVSLSSMPDGKIASSLNLSIRTVRNSLYRARRKLGISSRALLMQFPDVAQKETIDEALSSLTLSKRQKEVASLIVQGYKNEEISGKLGITLHTARNYIYGIFERCGVHTRSELIQTIRDKEKLKLLKESIMLRTISRRSGKPRNPGRGHRLQQMKELKAMGFTGKEIAGQLCLSEHTVRNYTHHLYREEHIRNRMQLIIADNLAQNKDKDFTYLLDGLKKKLTRRERQIVQLVGEGKTNREAATEINFTEHSVKNYLRIIFDKLGVFGRAELIPWAMALRQQEKKGTDTD